MLDVPGGPTAILRLARELWCVVDASGRFAQRGGPWVELLGWPEPTYRRLRFWELLHPSDVRQAEGVGRALRDEETSFTVGALSAFGSYVQVEWRVRPTGASSLLVVGSEVGDGDSAVRQLHEARARYRSLCEASFEAILVHEGGRVIDANDAAGRLLGYPRDCLVGMDLLELVPERERERVVARAHEHDPSVVETWARAADGRELPITARARSVHLGAGRAQRLVVLRRGHGLEPGA